MHPNRRSHHQRALTKDYILKNYLPIFFNALRNRCQVIIYLDPFAGPRRYEDQTEGSPLHVLKIAQSLSQTMSSSFFQKQLFFIFVEHDNNHYEALKRNVKEYSRLGFRIICIQSEAQYVVKEVVDHIRTEIADPSQIALFVYLDPWGLKGIDRDLVLENPETSHIRCSCRGITTLSSLSCMPFLSKL